MALSAVHVIEVTDEINIQGESK